MRKQIKQWIPIALLIGAAVIVCLFTSAYECPETPHAQECPYQISTQDCPYKDDK